MNTGSIISLIVSCVMMVVGVATFIITQVRHSSEEKEKQNKAEDEMKSQLAELSFLSRSIDTTTSDIKADVKGLSKSMNDMDTRVTLIEKEQETMWKRIDEVKEKVNL